MGRIPDFSALYIFNLALPDLYGYVTRMDGSVWNCMSIIMISKDLWCRQRSKLDSSFGSSCLCGNCEILCFASPFALLLGVRLLTRPDVVNDWNSCRIVLFLHFHDSTCPIPSHKLAQPYCRTLRLHELRGSLDIGEMTEQMAGDEGSPELRTDVGLHPNCELDTQRCIFSVQQSSWL